MRKETITYTDYNGVEITEDFFFNLNKAEIMEMELSSAGGMGERLQRIINSKDQPSLIKEFKKLILNSYGVKSDDGKRFMKTDEIRASFEQTEAYSILFMKLATDADAASKFVNGVIPADMAKEISKSGTPSIAASIN